MTTCVDLRVADDGVGIDTMNTSASGFGLIGMRERIEMVGGTLAVGPAARRRHGAARVAAGDEGLGAGAGGRVRRPDRRAAGLA